MRFMDDKPNIHIDATSVAQIVEAPEFSALFDAYAVECAIVGMPPPYAKIEVYKQLEANGVLQCFSAMTEGKLIGFITVLTTILPHYGVVTSVAESFYVDQEYRDTGAGEALIAKAKLHAKDVNSPGLILNAPYGGVLHKILERRKSARPSSIAFFCELP